MKCYRCNSLLDNSDYCTKCGADVSAYKVIIRASNAYYNQGLAKAKVRDLSGAASCLKMSLNINKKNIKARNLLGLVYFEMGEVVMALSEWVISKNLKPNRNVADVYIKRVQSNPNKLETMNQAIKRFNISLGYAKSGNTDVALIQLKKVVTMNPRLIKAGLLLALLFMKEGQNDRARKTLGKVLAIDRNNTLALRYMAELNGDSNEQDNKKRSRSQKSGEPRVMSGNDVIIPPGSYKEPSNGVFTVLSILLGVIIGAAVVWYLILPSRIANVNYDNNKIVSEYSQKLSEKAVEIASLNNSIENLTYQKEALEEELAIYTGDKGESNMYAMLIDAVDAYINYDFAEALINLQDIDVALLPTQTAKDVYTSMLEYCSKGADLFQSQGIKAYLEGEYITAVNYLKAALVYDETNEEVAYYLGLCYEQGEDKAQAVEYFEQFLETFKQSPHTDDVNQRLAALKSGE